MKFLLALVIFLGFGGFFLSKTILRKKQNPPAALPQAGKKPI